MAFLNKKIPLVEVSKNTFRFLCHFQASPPLPVQPITETLSGTAFLFHACVHITLYSGMIQISACAFLTGTTLFFSTAFPTPPLPGKSCVRSASDNNGFLVPGNPC